jgi:hypothetical protein
MKTMRQACSDWTDYALHGVAPAKVTGKVDAHGEMVSGITDEKSPKRTAAV